MNIKFVNYFLCPVTKKTLFLTIEELNKNDVITGFLSTENDEYSYPIIRGIPRFVNSEMYSESFGVEWNKWPRIQFEDDNIGKPMEGKTLEKFERITQWDEKIIMGKIIAEFGCGPGRFLDVVLKKGGIVIGIDLSLAVEAARQNFIDNENVCIVQADILNPPFRENIFDLVYSIGVLHHTPNPEKGVIQMMKTLKQSGEIVISVYPKFSFYDSPSVTIYRRLYKFIYLKFGERIATKFAMYYSYFAAHIISPISQTSQKIPIWSQVEKIIEHQFIVNLNHSDINWRILDIFDAITPFYASTHSPEEVQEWLLNSGCVKVQRTPWHRTSFKGEKKAD